MTSRIAPMLLADLSALRIAIALGAFSFAGGLLFGNIDNGEYTRMFNFMPNWAWAGAFLAYGTGKCTLALHWPFGKPLWLVVSVIVIGLFLWFYVYLSLIANGQSAAESMMLAVIACEILIGAQTLTEVTRG